MAFGFVIGYSYMLNNICTGCRSIPSSHNIARQKIVAYTMEIMDKIDDAKKRGAYNDLSVIAAALVNKLIEKT